MESRQHINRILLPLDGSPLAEQAIPYALAVADERTELVLIEATSRAAAMRDLPGEVDAETFRQVETAARATARANLDAVIDRRLKDRPGVTGEVVDGDPAERIVELGRERRVDLIVMASHGRGAFVRWAFGSVADRVVRLAHAPTMVMRPRESESADATPHVSRIVLPLDGSALANEATAFAVLLARQVEAPVHVVRVANPRNPLLFAPRAGTAIPGSGYEALDAAITREAYGTVEEAITRLQQEGVTASGQVLLSPDAATAIIGATEPGDLIVLTSHGRGGVRRWLLGSVAEKLIRSSLVPIVLVPSLARTAVSEE